MESIIDLAGKTWDFLVSLISSVSIFDLLDIAVVAVLLYFIYVFIRDRRAGKLAAGVVILVLLQLIAELLELNAMRFIMQNVFQVGLLALVVVFQPELRSALEKVGGEPLRSLKSIGEIRDKNDPAKSAAWIKQLCDAVTDMAADRTGALIVIEQTTPLGDVAAGGIIVNADMNSYMLKNIFFNKAPLHDGAVIIRGGRIWAASCFLPISTNKAISGSLGTRHRAAIGMSENSDAYVIVVSEETGTISIAHEGELRRGYDYNKLKAELEGLKFKHIHGG
jgi:diadenylate cyclase